MKEKNKHKMNLDKFAQIVQKEFSGIQEQFSGIQEQFSGIQEQFSDIRKEMATKSDLADLKEDMREEMRLETVKILSGVDKIITRFDIAEKEHAAHAMLHERITDELHSHDDRLTKLEIKL